LRFLLSHALETAVSKKRNALSLAYSREALRLCLTALPRVLQKGGDMEARSGMLLGAALGGLAIENSMLGAAHAAANPLTSRFGIVHGHAVGLMLPAVVRFNAEDSEVAPLYHQLALQGGLIDPHSPNGAPAGEKIARFLRGYQAEVGLPRSLSGIDVSDGDIALLAEDAAKQWTGTFNPRPVGAKEFAELYREVL